MKRLVLLLLLVASACLAQVETSGLVIPGEAVQIAKAAKAAEVSLMPTENLMLSFFEFNYNQATSSTAIFSDEGPQKYNLTQTTETKKPILTSSGLLFDGDDFLSKTGTSWGSGAVTLYFVGEPTDTTPQYQCIMDTAAESAPSSTRLAWYFDNTTLAFSRTNTGPGLTVNPRTQTRSIVWVSPFGTNSLPKTMLNGGTWGAPSATTNTGNPFTQLFLGTNYPNTIYWRGYMRAFVVYNVAHTEAQARNILSIIQDRITRGY